MQICALSHHQHHHRYGPGPRFQAATLPLNYCNSLSISSIACLYSILNKTGIMSLLKFTSAHVTSTSVVFALAQSPSLDSGL